MKTIKNNSTNNQNNQITSKTDSQSKEALQAIETLADAVLKASPMEALLKMLVLRTQEAVNSCYELLHSKDTVYNSPKDIIEPQTAFQGGIAYHAMNAAREFSFVNRYVTDPCMEEFIAKAYSAVDSLCKRLNCINAVNGE